MAISKNNKMSAHIGYRLRINLTDGRYFIGTLIAFDKHLNLVLKECDEFRTVKTKAKHPDGRPKEPTEVKRTLGLVILRGGHVVSMTVQGPPPASEESFAARIPGLVPGMPATPTAMPGMAKAAGRGLGPATAAAAPNLAGPARGVGAPAPQMMMPPGPPMMPPGGFGRGQFY